MKRKWDVILTYEGIEANTEAEAVFAAVQLGNKYTVYDAWESETDDNDD